MAVSYEKVTTTKAGLLASITSKIDANSAWACVGGVAEHTGGKIKYTFEYTSPQNTLLAKMYDGTGYNYEATATISTTGAGQTVTYYILINDTRIFLAFSTLDNDVYTNTAIYAGMISRFDTSDNHAWGLYVSGAPETVGREYPHEGIPYGCLETMYMRAITKYSDALGEPKSISSGNPYRSIIVTPFMFCDLKGYDGVESNYNSQGSKDNNLSGTPTFGSGNYRDLYEEEKYLGTRVKRIGVYREFDDHDGSGLRGTLDLVYHVEQSWSNSSDGIVIPKKMGMAPAEVSLLMSARGLGFLSNWTLDTNGWVVFPLSNKVDNFNIYNGLKVIAFPKYH
jgi:hypothetical protein